MEPPSIPPWVFTVEPLDGESLSHFIGRFRRANYSSVNEVGQKTGLGAVLGRWEKFRFIPPPSEKQLEALAKIVRVDVDQLKLMLPPQGMHMKHEPIRLCGACYGENPCHRIEWQYQSVWKCDRHNLKLLSKCPRCEAKFKIPALWENGRCSRCRITFSQLVRFQSP